MEYESKCKRCGHIQRITVRSDMQIAAFLNMITIWMKNNYIGQSYCPKCEKETIKELVSYQ